MNNLSNARLAEYANDKRMCNVNDEIVSMARELLALREAGKEPVYQYHIYGTWHDCDYEFYSGCHDEYRRVIHAAPQLSAVPDCAEQRLAAAVELLKQSAPHMLADESLKDPDGALCGKMPRHLIAETETTIAAAPKPEPAVKK